MTDIDDRRQRANDLMDALAASDIDATNINAERAGSVMLVHCDVDSDHLEDVLGFARRLGFERSQIVFNRDVTRVTFRTTDD